ncbi:MAG: PHB depolymerase family esterase [Bacteroidota bacterium]|nr:PHB depolymerase family esterase [Bacteroidota bacterium]
MIKRLIILLFIPLFSFSQQTITDSLIHNNIYRSYILYVPALYNPNNSAPLVLNLHGRTGTSFAAMWHADFRSIADTANFIIVHPQGLLNNSGETHWNYGQTTVDDIGFLNLLYTHLLANYNIDINRVYSAGMSNGGAMSYRLACDMSDKIAAIASVTGAMTSYQHLSCNPIHPTPVMEIHGTNDLLVPFSSMAPGLDYWKNYNNCNVFADTTIIPDINLTDSSTVEHIVYNNGDNGVSTELFKVINGEHSWPGSAFSSGVTNYDINASIEIWKFFSRYDINGLINTATSIYEEHSSEAELIKIVDMLGREVTKKKNQILFYIYSNGKIEKKVIF